MIEAAADERAAARQLRNLERARKVAAEKRRRRAREAPRRIKAIDRRLAELAKEYKELPPFPEGMEQRGQIREEIRDLGSERYELAWGKANRG